MKKLISLLLAAVMLTGSLPAALAASDTSASVIEQVVPRGIRENARLRLGL